MPEEWLVSVIDELTDRKQTPGGCCVSGFCGVLGAGLVSIVANLTLESDVHSPVEEKMKKILESAGTIKKTFSKLAKDDLVVYEEYQAALRMPKLSVEERKIRRAALSVRSKLIVSVPFEIVKQSVSLAAVALDVMENGDQSAVTDAATAVKLARTAAEIAENNVRFNLRHVHDGYFAEKVLSRMDTMLKDVAAIAAASDRILAKFQESVGD